MSTINTGFTRCYIKQACRNKKQKLYFYGWLGLWGSKTQALQNKSWSVVDRIFQRGIFTWAITSLVILKISYARLLIGTSDSNNKH